MASIQPPPSMFPSIKEYVLVETPPTLIQYCPFVFVPFKLFICRALSAGQNCDSPTAQPVPKSLAVKPKLD